MKMIVEGVMDGNLPWALIFIGVFIAIVVEILGIPVLPFAIGLYLPIGLSAPMMIGGLIRLYFERKKEKVEGENKKKIDRGVLYSSGLIAGEGIVGILLAVFAIIEVGNGKSLADVINLQNIFNADKIGGLIAFVLLCATLIYAMVGKKKEKAK